MLCLGGKSGRCIQIWKQENRKNLLTTSRFKEERGLNKQTDLAEKSVEAADKFSSSSCAIRFLISSSSHIRMKMSEDL